MAQPADTLRFDKVVLRRWRMSDLDTLQRVITEARDHLLPWMPFAATHSREQDKKYLAECRRQWAAGEGYNYAITSESELIGSCGLMRRIGPGGLEIGYWLHPAWTGRGLATMAAAALVEAARGLPGVDHIEIHHDQANQASGAVPRRLGFTVVSRARLPEGPATPGASGVQVVWRLPLGAPGG